MRFNTLPEWLSWQETHHFKAIDLSLSRVEIVARRLNVLQPEAKVITVGGTNGKGSCVAILQALLSGAGFRCGVYTSPHILHYCERIAIDGHFVSEAALMDAFHHIDMACQNISLTYFEFSTLAALYLFNQEALDVWILEVGLGGRLDATNIIDSDIAIITSIDLDHTDWLGNTREAIGFEKVGIARPGRPLICADLNPPESVKAAAVTLGCPFFRMGHEFDIIQNAHDVEFKINQQNWSIPDVQLPLPSVAAALQAMQILKGLNESIVQTLSGFKLTGRRQLFMRQGRPYILDVAHNPAAMAYLAKQYTGQSFVCVLAMMNDKDWAASLEALKPIVNYWCLTDFVDLPRSANKFNLSQQLLIHNWAKASQIGHFSSVKEALLYCDTLSQDKPVLLTGSFYTVAAATQFLQAGDT